MNGWDALSVTGAVLLIVAVAFGLVSFGTISERAGRRYARFGWVAFALACSCIIAAAWWAAT